MIGELLPQNDSFNSVTYPGGPRMIAAFVLTLPCDGASATLLNPSLVCIVDPDATVPDPGPICGSGRSPIDDTFEAGESGEEATICPDVPLLDDMVSLGSSAVPTVPGLPLDPLEPTTNDPRDVASWRE